MTAQQLPEISADPSDGEVGDAKAVETPLRPPKPLEERVIDALTNGLEADFDDWQKSKPDTEQEKAWDDARTLRGEFIVELCTSVKKGTRSFPRGIRIKGARITRGIDLTTGSVDALLLLERCRIEGDVMLRDATTRLVNLSGSRVCGHITADRLRSSAGVYFRKQIDAEQQRFVCEGSIRLAAAVIDGDLDCNGARILNERPKKKTPEAGEDYALRCDRTNVAGSVFMKGIEARGPVRLADAKVGASVVIDGATLSGCGESNAALMADNVRIEGSLVLRRWPAPPNGEIRVRNANAGVLQLGATTETWPNKGTVLAQGFRFGTLEGDGKVNRDLCLRWLGLLVRKPFSPQPYEKCVQVLRENGLADDAKRIAIRRRRVQRSLLKSPEGGAWRRVLAYVALPGRWLLDVFLDLTIGYGYRPGRSVAMLAILATLGWWVFDAAQRHGAMVPTDTALARVYPAHHDSLPPGYPPLVAPIYSLDVLLPIIDFQQDSKWRPDPAAKMVLGARRAFPIGIFAIRYAWVQIALGWILSTLLVGSVTGLIRKE